MYTFDRNEKFITSDKIFYHLDRLREWERGKEVFPVTVEIHPTDACNNKCYYCGYKKEPVSIVKKDFVTILKKLKQIHVRGIILSGGGEPILNPETKNFLRLIKKGGFEAALITNLSIYDKFLFQNILKFTEWCRISLDACKGRTYKEIRGVNTFNRVIDNIRRLTGLKRKLRYRSTIGIQMVVCKENLNEIFGLIKLGSDLKADYVQIRPLEIMPSKPIPYSRKDYGIILSQLKRAKPLETDSFKVIFSNKWDIVDPGNKKKSHGFTFCHGCFFIGAIDARGDYYVCCHKVESRDKRFCYGNVIREPIGVIMSRRKKITKNINLEDCYLECRGSNLNRRLEGLLHQQEHKAFL